MNDLAARRRETRDYVFEMLDELARLSLRCGDKVTSAEILIVLHDALDRAKREDAARQLKTMD